MWPVPVLHRACTWIECGFGPIILVIAYCLFPSSRFPMPSFLLARPVLRRLCPGGTLDIPRCVPGVDHELPFICRAFIALFASSALPSAFGANFIRIEYCCPESGPGWSRRGRLRNCALAANRFDKRCARPPRKPSALLVRLAGGCVVAKAAFSGRDGRRWLWLRQPIECRRVCRIYGNGHRVDIAAAGQIKPLAGAQAVSLGLENPTQMIGRPRDRERFTADAGRNIGRIVGGVGV